MKINGTWGGEDAGRTIYDNMPPHKKGASLPAATNFFVMVTSIGSRRSPCFTSARGRMMEAVFVICIRTPRTLTPHFKLRLSFWRSSLEAESCPRFVCS